jgi:shikimate kinase
MNHEAQYTHRSNLYLIGFMGTGKSVVGQLAAKMLGLSFLDSDLEIEKKHQTSISKIFKIHGEIGFRKMERDFIQSGHPKTGCLISCGGGLPIAEGMIEILKSNGKVFTLWASPKTIFERTKKNSSRPLLQTEDPLSKIAELLSEREIRYRMADKIISTDAKSPSEVATLIQKYYLEELN